MKVRFGAPAAGWVQLTISDDAGVRWSGALSAVPDDPLLALADFACAAAGGLPARATLHLEPDLLVFELQGGRFSIRRRPRGGAAVDLVELDQSGIGLAVAFWRALRELEARSPPEVWPHPFPTGRVARLSEAVATARGAPL